MPRIFTLKRLSTRVNVFAIGGPPLVDSSFNTNFIRFAIRRFKYLRWRIWRIFCYVVSRNPSRFSELDWPFDFDRFFMLGILFHKEKPDLHQKSQSSIKYMALPRTNSGAVVRASLSMLNARSSWSGLHFQGSSVRVSRCRGVAMAANCEQNFL